MAIILESESKRSTNWPMIITFVVIFALVIVGSYFLFFTDAPVLESLLDRRQQLTQEIAEVTLPKESIENNPTYQILQLYPGAPPVGSVGRSNPFLKF